MDKYYHTTKYEYLNDISEFGLIPKIGERSKSVNDEKEVVYLSKGKIPTILMFFAMKWFYEAHKGEAGEQLLKSSEESIKHFDKLIEKHQNKKFSLFARNIDELKSSREDAITTRNQVENMKKYSSFEDYWGSGVYLSVTNIPDVKYNHPDTHNCWVENGIAPGNINVVMLKNKETGELIDDKLAIINYFMATIPVRDLFVEYTNTIGINDDKYTIHETMLYFVNYYSNNEDKFNKLKNNYELLELPIKEYVSLKDSNKSFASI